MIYHYIWLKDPDPGFQDPGPGRPNPGFQEGGPGRPETLPREDPENPGPGGRSIAAVSVLGISEGGGEGGQRTSISQAAPLTLARG